MKLNYLISLFFCGLLVFAILSCGDDDNPSCNTFSSADSVCFCTKNPDDAHCVFTSFSISLYSEEKAALTPHAANGTLWCKGFAIDNSIYVIDRESASPNSFWKFDIDKNETWEEKSDFPGTDYGLTGSANGKGYASSYASKKFWEYSPTNNEWTPLADLPFSPGETHWVEYNGKFYVPNHDGIYEFNASSKEWTKISNQASSGFGAIFLTGDDMYWYNINDDYMNRFNLAAKTFGTHDLPEDFGSSVAFNSPFLLGNTVYLISSSSLWIFNSSTRTWSVDDDAVEEGSAYGDDVFVIEGKAYLVDNGYLKLFEGVD
jgi:hypothetical protein